MMKKAFTLVELLIVIAVLGMLAGLIMPVVTRAAVHADISATKILLARTDGAIRVYKKEVGFYPEEVATDTTDTNFMGPWLNTLVWHIGTDMTKAERDSAKNAASLTRKDSTDVNAYSISEWNEISVQLPDGMQYVTFTDLHSGGVTPNISAGTRSPQNTLEIMEPITDGSFPNLTRITNVLKSALVDRENGHRYREALRPEWRVNYLGQIEEHFWRDADGDASNNGLDDRGECLVDAFGNPLIYSALCWDALGDTYVKESRMSGAGITAAYKNIVLAYDSVDKRWERAYWAVKPGVWTASSGAWTAENWQDSDYDAFIDYVVDSDPFFEGSAPTTPVVSSKMYGWIPPGNELAREVRAVDCADADDDFRTKAYRGFEYSFELWSAGPDGLFHCLRNGTILDGTNQEWVNEDNLTATEWRP